MVSGSWRAQEGLRGLRGQGNKIKAAVVSPDPSEQTLRSLVIMRNGSGGSTAVVSDC